MTRTFFSKVVLVSLASLIALSAWADSSRSRNQANGGVPGEPDIDGCGLGWQVTREKTLLGSITRGTTNETVPPSFGMTSGTLGCRQLPVSLNDQSAFKYAYVNMDSLSVDMAAGHGEYLQAFAQTMGCGAVSDSFSQMAQARYDAIMNHGKADALQMFENVKREIRSDAFLSSSCGV
jgi:hypothetical protein